MKKFFIIIGIIFILLIGVIIAIPIIFKDDIRAAVDDIIAENLNAKVYYDPDGFSLSLITNFPNFTLGMKDFGIAGKGVFESDTLVDISSFEFEIDLMSVIKGETIVINAITLDRPRINVLVLPDGMANYDITYPSDSTEVEETTEPSAFSMAIKKWVIINGDILYVDQTLPMTANIVGLNHQGSGDFAKDIFDMITLSTVDHLTVDYDGVSYISDKTFQADLTMSMDLPNMKFTFKENTFSLNDFAIGMDGFVAMPGDDIDMDLNFQGKDITIKSLISLIPGVYTEYLAGVEANGGIEFSGYARGAYNDKRLPDINMNLGVNNGTIKYAEYPIPMEQLNIKSTLNVPGENMDNMVFDMPDFSMMMAGEKMKANLYFTNLVNYTWKFGMEGKLDLEKLFKIIPIDSMDIKGLVSANFSTEGNMAQIEAEKYDEIVAQGTMGLKDFSFKSADLPQGFGIQSTEMTFTPKEVLLKHFDATIGRSDMHMKGSLVNFIGFALSDEQVLKGELDFSSKLFDLDELMADEEVEEVEDTTALEVVRIPKNVDFKLMSKLDKILYDSMEITDLNGLITVKEGIARLNNVDFDLLKGDFLMTGMYNSAVEKPLFDFTFNIKNLSIPESYKTFNTVKKMAPIAKNITGNFSADLAMAGTLGGDMMPIDETLSGKGTILIANASLQGDNIMKAVSLLTKSEGENLPLKDLKLNVEIKNGRLFVDPFDITMRGEKVTVYGSNGLDGSLDYFMKVPVKTGAVGDAVNSYLASYTGGNKIVSEKMILNLNVTGTYDKPKVSIASTENADGKSSKQVVKDMAMEKLDDAKQKAQEEIDKQKKIAEEKAQAEIDKQKKIAEEKAQKEADVLKNKAKEKVKGLF